MNDLQKKNNIKTIVIVLVVWFLISSYYFMRTPFGHRTHDLWGHVPYTKIIATEHRLPKPYEGWETFQPPLYYLINSFIAPEAFNNNDEAKHINLVRCLSILYGAISLILMAILLNEFTENIISRILSLLFIATTPTFVFVFSTYNNDSLFTMLTIAMITISYKLYKNWSLKLAGILLLVTTAALYTKILTVFLMAIIGFCCCKNLLKRKLPDKVQIYILGILFASSILLTPWLYFHNYKHTGKLSPTNGDKEMCKEFTFDHFKNLVGIVFRIPAIQLHKVDYSHEWDDPWQHPNWEFVPPETKRYDFFANSFVTSIIGEYKLETPSVEFIWIIYWIHFLAHIAGIKECFALSSTRLAGFIILLGYLLQISTVPLFPDLPQRNMAFRYITWTWAPWAILYANALCNKSKFSFILNKMLMVGILVQIYILMTITGSGV